MKNDIIIITTLRNIIIRNELRIVHAKVDTFLDRYDEILFVTFNGSITVNSKKLVEELL